MNKILVSACLRGAKVRYDGGHHLIDHPVLSRWQRQGRLVTVCPEATGGLPTPRTAAEIQCKFPILVTDRNGQDVTPQLLAGAERTLALVQEQSICCALMKARSPSCSNDRVYDGSFNGVLTEGAGIAAGELMRAGIPVFNETQLHELITFVDSLEQG